MITVKYGRGVSIHNEFGIRAEFSDGTRIENTVGAYNAMDAKDYAMRLAKTYERDGVGVEVFNTDTEFVIYSTRL